ncbi:hypothetical protein [Arthrobacter woluwensis]|uniref:Protein ImuA n=1 Tax=Arthrobacter woluwensis TaxID=156980 RepID=A0A1H4LSI5_9MICC|nr:hypothetical protein [Arthrobacter woluwensis]SEB73750.1 hypothetical protein SAMN04489745_1111 [Arthrobacter woluwensis]
MPLPLSSVSTASAEDGLRALQERIHVMQGRGNREGSHPVIPGFRGLFPYGLKGGAAYSLAAPLSVAMALLAGPSANGQWCGAAGIPDFGAEAAAGFGVALERFVLVPDTGPEWVPVISTLADVLPVLLVRPPGKVSPGDAARLASRLRERGGTLLVLGPWPQSEGLLRVRGSHWEGLGDGHGHLRRHRVELELQHRGRTRTASLDLAALDSSGNLDGAGIWQGTGGQSASRAPRTSTVRRPALVQVSP